MDRVFCLDLVRDLSALSCWYGKLLLTHPATNFLVQQLLRRPGKITTTTKSYVSNLALSATDTTNSVERCESISTYHINNPKVDGWLLFLFKVSSPERTILFSENPGWQFFQQNLVFFLLNT